jgi:tetratricopeptide (TPR) repeat protein
MDEYDDHLKIHQRAILGAFFCFGGIILTVASYSFADIGEEYSIFWGTILVGLYLIITGLGEAKVSKEYNKLMERASLGQVTKEDWNKKGIDFFNFEKYDVAIKLYDAALEMDPRYENAWVNKGVALNKLGKYTEAIEALNNAIEINPQNATTWHSKAVVLKKLGNKAEADAAFAKAKELGYTH